MVKAILFDFSRVLLFHLDENYEGSLNEFHNERVGTEGYKIFEHFYLNQELLTELEKLKHKVKLYILTSESIQDEPEFSEYISPIFEKVYSAKKIGLSKKDPAIYEWVSQDVGLKVGEILFVDDSEVNIKAAKEAGMMTIQYQNNEELLPEIRSYLDIKD